MEIVFTKTGAIGVATLNRPEALNALTLEMCAAFRAQLIDWERDPEVAAVLVKGAGGKAFCAGGDIRWVSETSKTDFERACRFFHEEYRLNSLIHHYSKPYIALIDGIVMGGGAGLSVHGDFRVAGDTTLFAMPETAVGLFPDVGGGHFLPRLHDGLGLYYALTGARAKAADCIAAGVATHYVSSARMGELEADLARLSFGGDPHGRIEAVLDEFAADPGPAHVNQIRPALKRLFEGFDSFDAFYANLNSDGHDVAGDMLRILARMSPTSMKLAFEQLRRGHGLSFDDEIRIEYRMARRCVEAHDFHEGVRAVLIDKDKAPRWSPASVEGVSDADIERYFEPIEEELVLP